MFVTYKVFHFINKTDILPHAVFFRFFCFLKLQFLPENSFEPMSARLCAMEATPPPANAEIAYAATGDHRLFMLTVNAVLAAAIHGGYLDRFEMWRYDVPDAFLQLPLPVPYYGRLPADLPYQALQVSKPFAIVTPSLSTLLPWIAISAWDSATTLPLVPSLPLCFTRS